ncbi:MAG: DUF1854 domain-containing protein [Clostridia bacterium]|nr:DUF1854 domain-containing protein [Clostridia bacterium]
MAIGEIEKNEEEYGRYGAGLFERQALEATRVRYITPENAEFEDRDGCLFMRDRSTGGEDEKRVMLHLLFPYSSRRELVSVLNTEQDEIGMIADIGLFEGEQEKALEKEIARKYFIRKIVKINELKEKNGMTIWKVTDADGNKPEFSLKDTYGSIFRVSDERFVITDADGNRFEIEDLSRLDAKSRKKIELYI